MQELVDMDDWTAASPMTFIITGTDEREAHSFNGSGTAPELVVEYDNPFLGNRYFVTIEENNLVSGSTITLPSPTSYYTLSLIHI